MAARSDWTSASSRPISASSLFCLVSARARMCFSQHFFLRRSPGGDPEGGAAIYIVMAFIVMACIVMACIGMALYSYGLYG